MTVASPMSMVIDGPLAGAPGARRRTGGEMNTKWVFNESTEVPRQELGWGRTGYCWIAGPTMVRA